MENYGNKIHQIGLTCDKNSLFCSILRNKNKDSSRNTLFHKSVKNQLPIAADE